MSVRSMYRFARIPEWVLHHEALDGNDVRVYGVLDRFDGGEGVYPSLATLAELCHRSEDTVRRSIRALERVGAVNTEPQHDDSGRQTSNNYLLAGDVPLAAASARGSNVATDGSSKPATDEGGKAATQKRATGKRARGTTSSSATPFDGMQPPPEPEPTSAQIAKQMLDAYWAFIRKQTGRDPIAIQPGQFLKLVTPFLAAEYPVSPKALWCALKLLHESGTPLSLQTIERELNGTGRRNGRGRATPVDALSAMTFDGAGNLVQ